jgi:hypothetical protein
LQQLAWARFLAAFALVVRVLVGGRGERGHKLMTDWLLM